MQHEHEMSPKQAAKRWLMVYAGTFGLTIFASMAAIAYLWLGEGDYSDAVMSVFAGTLVAVFFIRRYCIRRLDQIRHLDQIGPPETGH